MQELIYVIDDEIDVLQDHAGDEGVKDWDLKSLISAKNKLIKRNRNLTKSEKAAVKDALQDVGELYLFAGTSAGYEDEDNTRLDATNKYIGQKALTQARSLVI